MLNQAAAVIQKAWGRYSNKRGYLELQASAFDVVQGRKERRQDSVFRKYVGDNLNFSFNPLVKRMLEQSG